MYISTGNRSKCCFAFFHTPRGVQQQLWVGLNWQAPHPHPRSVPLSHSFPELFACAAIGWWIIILVRCWQIRPTGIISVHCPRTSGRDGQQHLKNMTLSHHSHLNAITHSGNRIWSTIPHVLAMICIATIDSLFIVDDRPPANSSQPPYPLLTTPRATHTANTRSTSEHIHIPISMQTNPVLHNVLNSPIILFRIT